MTIPIHKVICTILCQILNPNISKSNVCNIAASDILSSVISSLLNNHEDSSILLGRFFLVDLIYRIYEIKFSDFIAKKAFIFLLIEKFIVLIGSCPNHSVSVRHALNKNPSKDE